MAELETLKLDVCLKPAATGFEFASREDGFSDVELEISIEAKSCTNWHITDVAQTCTVPKPGVSISLWLKKRTHYSGAMLKQAAEFLYAHHRADMQEHVDENYEDACRDAAVNARLDFEKHASF